VPLNSATEATEAESVIVTGTFDIYPVEYPALPPVEGTRINSEQEDLVREAGRVPRLFQ
jgi:hypothetical protein